MRIYNAWNRGGLTSEWVEVTGKWRLWQKCCMKLVTELECIWRHDGGEARKWKDCAKRIREKEGGWLSLLAVTSGHHRLENISSAIGQTKHPCACFLSPSLLYTDDRTRTPGPLDSNRKPPNSLSLSLSLALSPQALTGVKSGLKYGEINSSTLQFITPWATICCLCTQRRHLFYCRLVFHKDFLQRFLSRWLIQVGWSLQPSKDPVILLSAYLSTNRDR